MPSCLAVPHSAGRKKAFPEARRMRAGGPSSRMIMRWQLRQTHRDRGRDNDLEERLERLKAALGQASKAGLSVDVTNIDWSD